VPSEQGKEQVIEILEAGDFRVAVQPLCVSTATTMTECVTLDQAEHRREAHHSEASPPSEVAERKWVRFPIADDAIG
jgi:hypothetical protein